MLTDQGLSVILCTPTAAPPKWLTNRADILMRDRYGRARGWGARRCACANNAAYREASDRIVRAMAEHYAHDERIVAWQIDNEFGCHDTARCYCDSCRERFGKWLAESYGDIKSLNERWGTVFWSQIYDSFEDVILPAYNSCEPENARSQSHNPSLEMEFMRFSSESWAAFAARQVSIIKGFDADAKVTTNLMGHFADLDYYRLMQPMDFVAWDNYPMDQWTWHAIRESGSEAGDHMRYTWVSMAHEIMRGVKDRNFIVMEEQSGPCGWDVMGPAPEPGQLRLWVYQALAHGGEGILYFRFMAAPFGMEQYWYGILDQDGVPRRRYAEVQRIGRELQRLQHLFVDRAPDYDALIVRDYENTWGHGIKRHTESFDYEELLHQYYRSLSRLGIQTAVGLGDYRRYKMVLMPAYNIVDPDELARVREYVREGGCLIVTYRSGQRNRDNVIERTPLPCAFRELAGVEVEEFDPSGRQTHIRGLIESVSHIWCDVVRPLTASVVSSYVDRHFKGSAAITVNDYGKGRVYYVGCDLDNEGRDDLMRLIARESGATIQEEIAGVELVRRKDCTILMNHTGGFVQCFNRGITLEGGRVFDGRLAPYAVEILQPEG